MEMGPLMLEKNVTMETCLILMDVLLPAKLNLPGLVIGLISTPLQFAFRIVETGSF